MILKLVINQEWNMNIIQANADYLKNKIIFAW